MSYRYEAIFGIYHRSSIAHFDGPAPGNAYGATKQAA